MIVTIPEQFMNTIEEVIASNRTPTMFDGIPMTEEFRFSEDPLKRQLYSRAAERGTLYPLRNILGISDGIRKQGHVGFFYKRLSARLVQSMECIKWIDNLSGIDKIPKLGMSDPVGSAHSAFMYSLSIDDEVMKRLDRTYSWLLESGVLHMDDKYPKLNTQMVSQEHMIQCLMRMDRGKERTQKEIQITSQVIPAFVGGLALGFLLAFSCFLLEFCSASVEQFVLYNPNRQKSLLAKVICKVQPADRRRKEDLIQQKVEVVNKEAGKVWSFLQILFQFFMLSRIKEES